MFKVNEYFDGEVKSLTSFTVEAGKKFQLKVAADAAYVCFYR